MTNKLTPEQTEVEKLAEIIKTRALKKGEEKFVSYEEIAQAILDAGYLPVETAHLVGLTDEEDHDELSALIEQSAVGRNLPDIRKLCELVSQAVLAKNEQGLYRRKQNE